MTDPGATGAVAWRNLGRNRRRTWLTASAIGFASMLLVFAMSLQSGSYGIMIDNAARLISGHAQVQHPRWQDEKSIRNHLDHADRRMQALAAVPGVVRVMPRAQSFAVLSGDVRSFGGRVMGVDPGRERGFSLLPEFVTDGTWLTGASGEIVLGSALARNLDVTTGDEVVILGTAIDGSIAAAAAQVVGLLETGQVELDRSLAQIPIADFREAFLLRGGAHALVVQLDQVRRASALVPRLAAAARLGGDDTVVVRDWSELLPEVAQMIELDRITSYFFYVLLALMVTFSIANTFMMTVFERTREFGTLMAVGARPNFVIGLLQLEALALCGLGVAGGTLAGIIVTLVVGWIGIPMDEVGAELLRQYHLPDRIHPGLTPRAIWTGPLFMLAATQLAALLPALRLRRLQPAVALRE